MSTKNDKHSGHEGMDGSRTGNKGESGQNPQKGAIGVSKHANGKHTKDESHGSDKMTTKKQGNSI